MSRHVLACGLLAVLVGGPLLAEESSKPAKDDKVIALESKLVAKRVLSAWDLILEHHISPPTRQEMAGAAASAVYRESKVSFLQEPLTARVSWLSTREDFQAFLESVASEVLRHSDFETSRVADTMIRGALLSAKGDAALMTAKDAAVEQQLKGNRYVGVGIALRTDDDSKLTQVATLLDGPGAKAGLKMNDLLVSIDGQSLTGKSIQQVVDLLRGPEGTSLVLDVRAPGDTSSVKTRTLKITRNIVPIKTIQGMMEEGDVATRFKADSAAPVAYVRLTRIGASVAQELEQLEPRLAAAGFRALILDLRSVRSDDLHHAVLLIDALLDQGPIGKMQNSTGSKEFIADRDCLFRDWPLAVLVDQGTAGTAEWVAAALQDRQRATIIGFKTAGEPYIGSFVAIPGSDQVLQIATGMLERDANAEKLRKKKNPPRRLLFGMLPPAEDLLFGKDPADGAWRVSPDRIPSASPFVEPSLKSLAMLRSRNQPTGERQPAVSLTPAPQSPPAQPLEKASRGRDYFIEDALNTLQKQLHELKTSSTN